MKTTTSRHSSERGAVLIHVAIALLGLVAFSTFVVDYGVMWVSRGQAQTSADAGALSGALALAFDNPTDFVGAQQKAQAVAWQNLVFGQAPDVQPTDVTFPTCPPGAPGPPDKCVKVDVFRNQARGNPLPMFFGNIVSVGSQGVVATATAQIISGTQTECLKPWAVLDRWDEFDPAGAEPDFPSPDPDYNAQSTYDRYSTGTGNQAPPENDMYVPPGPTSTGTGFTLPADHGRQFAVKVGDNSQSVSSGWFRAIAIPRLDGRTGGSVYRDNIESCGGLPNGFATPNTVCPTDANVIMQNAAYWASQGCYVVEPGDKVGPTQQGITTLLARDSGAQWSNNGIIGSAFSPATSSPRVVPIGVLDIDSYLAPDPTGRNGIVRLVNIYGFFIEGMGDVDAQGNITCCSNGGRSVIGRIMTIPGLGTGTSTLPTASSFLNRVILVR